VSKVEKLIPTATGPFTQFILRPLNKPFLKPSSLKHGMETNMEISYLKIRVIIFRGGKVLVP
jgi:hypothetical protein